MVYPAIGDPPLMDPAFRSPEIKIIPGHGEHVYVAVFSPSFRKV